MTVYISLIQHELEHLFLTFLAFILVIIIFLNRKHERNHKYIRFAIIGSILGGFFVDFDHLYDYLLAFGFSFHPDYFFRGYAFAVSQKMYVPFHAWEWVGILVALGYSFQNKRWKLFFFALTLGLFFHLLYDTYTNGVSFFGYSFFYRLLYNFESLHFSNF